MWVPVDVTPGQVPEQVSAPSTADGEVREAEGLKPASTHERPHPDSDAGVTHDRL